MNHELVQIVNELIDQIGIDCDDCIETSEGVQFGFIHAAPIVIERIGIGRRVHRINGWQILEEKYYPGDKYSDDTWDYIPLGEFDRIDQVAKFMLISYISRVIDVKLEQISCKRFML